MKLMNRRSIKFKMWTYFALFSIMIMAVLWFFQIVFLNSFYEIMKKQSISRLADEIIARYETERFDAYLDRTAFQNSVLIIISDYAGEVAYYSDEHGTGDLWKPAPNDTTDVPKSATDKPMPRDYNDFLNKLGESENGVVAYTVSQERFEGQTLVYGVKMDEGTLYISAPLPPVGTTIEVLKTQLFYVTLISLVFSLLLGYFISQKVSRPIMEINQQAKKLSGGEYKLRISKGSYSEIDELASTLEQTGEELSRIENLRQELIANISHDFRTPLTMIKAYSEMVRDISGDVPEKREKHLKVIEDEADRLSELVNDILELSSLQSGNESMSEKVFDMSLLVQSVMGRFVPLKEIYALEFEADIEENLFIKGDLGMIERVIYNLIGNAVNYTNNGGTIRVVLKRTDLGTRFEVLDSGIGIPKADLKHIWERYYKSRSPEDKVKSTGLGLSIVKNILELHGAVYAAENRPSGGSRFWFEIRQI